MLSILTFVSLLALPLQRPTDVVKWSADPAAAAVASGERLTLRVTARIEPGWKLYAITQPQGGPKPLSFGLSAESTFRIDTKKIGGPPPKVLKQDENFAIDTNYYENEARFTVPVSLTRSTPAGSVTVPLEVTFQACGKELCLRPFTQKLPVVVVVRAARQ
jgi:hypothetical protein